MLKTLLFILYLIIEIILFSVICYCVLLLCYFLFCLICLFLIQGYRDLLLFGWEKSAKRKFVSLWLFMEIDRQCEILQQSCSKLLFQCKIHILNFFLFYLYSVLVNFPFLPQGNDNCTLENESIPVKTLLPSIHFCAQWQINEYCPKRHTNKRNPRFAYLPN